MTKKKLIISLCAFVLVAALGVVGVLAAAQTSASITTHVQFTATDVVATYTVIVEEENYNDTTFTQKGETITGTIAHDSSTISHTVPTASFAEKNGARIRYIVTVVNTGARSFTIDLGTIPTITDGNATVAGVMQVDNDNNATDDWTNHTNGTKIITGGKAQFTYTVTLTDATKNVTTQNLSFNPTMTGVA